MWRQPMPMGCSHCTFVAFDEAQPVCGLCLVCVFKTSSCPVHAVASAVMAHAQHADYTAHMQSQLFRHVSRATPRLVQCEPGCTEGRRISITKLVLCPVVDSVPRLSLVLYSGAA